MNCKDFMFTYNTDKNDSFPTLCRVRLFRRFLKNTEFFIAVISEIADNPSVSIANSTSKLIPALYYHLKNPEFIYWVEHYDSHSYWNINCNETFTHINYKMYPQGTEREPMKLEELNELIGEPWQSEHKID